MFCNASNVWYLIRCGLTDNYMYENLVRDTIILKFVLVLVVDLETMYISKFEWCIFKDFYRFNNII